MGTVKLTRHFLLFIGSGTGVELFYALDFQQRPGAQFTSDVFTARLESANIRISWAGAGRVFDNIYIERLWRTVKYENVYLHPYDSVQAAWCGLNNYFKFYNVERLHGALHKKTPHEVYFQQL